MGLMRMGCQSRLRLRSIINHIQYKDLSIHVLLSFIDVALTFVLDYLLLFKQLVIFSLFLLYAWSCSSMFLLLFVVCLQYMYRILSMRTRTAHLT